MTTILSLQVTPWNYPVIQTWAKDHVRNEDTEGVWIITERGDVLARIGDWLHRGPTGKIKIERQRMSERRQ